MFKITYEIINNHRKEIIECSNQNCKSKNCIIRYDDLNEDGNDVEFYLCLDCGETEIL